MSRGLWFGAGILVGMAVVNEGTRLIVWWAERPYREGRD